MVQSQYIPSTLTDVTITTRIIGSAMAPSPQLGSSVKSINVAVKDLFELLASGSFVNDIRSSSVSHQKAYTSLLYAKYPKRSFQDFFIPEESDERFRLYRNDIDDDLPSQDNTVKAMVCAANSTLIANGSGDVTDGAIWLEISLQFQQRMTNENFKNLQAYILSLDVKSELQTLHDIYVTDQESGLETLLQQIKLTQYVETTLKELFENLESSQRNAIITSPADDVYSILISLDNITLVPQDFTQQETASRHFSARAKKNSGITGIIKAITSVVKSPVSRVENFMNKIDTLAVVTSATIISKTETAIGNVIPTNIIAPVINGVITDITKGVQSIVNKPIAKFAIIDDWLKGLKSVTPDLFYSVTNILNDVVEFSKKEQNLVFNSIIQLANKNGEDALNAMKNVEKIIAQYVRSSGSGLNDALSVYDEIANAIKDPQLPKTVLSVLDKYQGDAFKGWDSVQSSLWYQILAPIVFLVGDPLGILNLMLALLSFASSQQKVLLYLVDNGYDGEKAFKDPVFIELFITLIVNFVCLIFAIIGFVVACVSEGTSNAANQGTQIAVKETAKQPTTRERMMTCFLKIDKTGRISILNKMKLMIKVIKLFRDIVFPLLKRLERRPDFFFLPIQDKIEFIGKPVMNILLVTVRAFETDIECVITGTSISYPLIHPMVWKLVGDLFNSGFDDLDYIIKNSKDWFDVDIK